MPMTTAYYALLYLLDLNNWSFIPNYPFEYSLDELEPTHEVEKYCEKVLKDLPSLIAENE